MHFPFNHPGAPDFLSDINRIYKPTRIINLGDLIDFHGPSYHEESTQADGPDIEFSKARQSIQQTMMKIFPEMESVFSNHTDLPKRKGQTAKIPSQLIRTMQEALGAPIGWTWVPKIITTLPNGQKALFCHNKGANVLQASKDLGVSLIQGHYHSKFSAQIYATETGEQRFGFQLPCLIDNESYAFAYNKNVSKLPALGAGLIADGFPIPLPLMDKV